jgi:hypothetical protein
VAKAARQGAAASRRLRWAERVQIDPRRLVVPKRAVARGTHQIGHDADPASARAPEADRREAPIAHREPDAEK